MPFKKVKLVPEPEDEEPTEPTGPKRPPSRQEIKDAMRVKQLQNQPRTREAEEIVKVIPGNCDHDWSFSTSGGVYVYTCRKCGNIVTTQ